MFRFAKLLSKIIMIVTAGVVLFSCGPVFKSDDGITEIKLTSISDSIELVQGESSPIYYLIAEGASDHSLDEVAVVNVDESIAEVKLSRTEISELFSFTVKALNVGESFICFKTTDGTVSSEILHVTVSASPDESVAAEDEANTEEKIFTQTDGVPFDDVTDQTETDGMSVPDTSLETDADEVLETADTTECRDGTKVYVTPSGERYHFEASCAGKNAIETTLDEAIKSRTPCKKCAGG